MNELLAFAQVVLIDLLLAGDNAVVIGALAANISPERRSRVILWGIALAIVARVILSLFVVWLLYIPGIMVIGGATLFWVAWKMWRDIRNVSGSGADSKRRQDMGFIGALVAILIADMSMSLDNVLGVAGAAKGHALALVFGLALSMILMGVGASVVARIINRRPWIAYIGLGLIVFVGARMIWDGV